MTLHNILKSTPTKKPEEPNIIGVVKNYHHRSLKQSIIPMIFCLSEGGSYFLVKLDGSEINESISHLKQKWNEVFSGQPFDYFFLDEFFNNQYRAEQLFGKVMTFFTSLAIFIAALGLFGQTLFTVNRRVKEIGIRKVLGASVPKIIILLSGDFTKCVLIANIFAWPLSYFVMSLWLQNYAYRISIGLWSFILAGIISLFIAISTVSVLAYKAAMVNPSHSLRYE